MRRSVMAYQALALLEVASYKDALVMFRHLLIEQGHLFINLHEVSAPKAFWMCFSLRRCIQFLHWAANLT